MSDRDADMELGHVFIFAVVGYVYIHQNTESPLDTALLLGIHCDVEDRSRIIFRNVRRFLPDYKSIHSRRQYSPQSLL